MAEGLFIQRNDIVKFTALQGNVDTDKFIQFVKIAQDTHVQNYLGTDLFNKIQSDIEGSTLTGDYLALVTDHVKFMTLHWAMVEYLPFTAYTIANKGVYKHTSETGEVVDKNEIDYLVEKQRKIAEHYTQRFIDYMCYNQSSFPEYNSNSNDDMYPDRNTNFSGWVL